MSRRASLTSTRWDDLTFIYISSRRSASKTFSDHIRDATTFQVLGTHSLQVACFALQKIQSFMMDACCHAAVPKFQRWFPAFVGTCFFSGGLHISSVRVFFSTYISDSVLEPQTVRRYFVPCVLRVIMPSGEENHFCTSRPGIFSDAVKWCTSRSMPLDVRCCTFAGTQVSSTSFLASGGDLRAFPWLWCHAVCVLTGES